MIEVQNLTKYYGEFMAIEGVSFRVKKGEIVGFLGPNGAGKTTTMRILAGYLPATSGTARIASFDVFKDSLEVRRRIGYLPETVPLYTDMTVRDYLGFFANLKGVEPKQKKQRVDYAIEACRVGPRSEMLIGKLSKGFRQRVGLANAILHEPPVLILDEPTIGLDPEEIIAIRNLIKELGKEHTIILSSHILPEVSATCSRVIIINEGRIAAVDTPERLTARLAGVERLEIEVRGPTNQVVTSLMKIEGVLNVSHQAHNGSVRYAIECRRGVDLRETVASTIIKNGWGLLELRQRGMSLEEIFLKLTTKEESVQG